MPVTLAETAGQTEIVDVWSRTTPKYRRRAAVLLAVTLALFAGLCCFAYWLRTGSYGPWADRRLYADLMWRSFDPSGESQVTLVDFLLFPINVEQVPIQWVIMGLLVASLASFPILVAILYRFPASMPCALMVGALAAMPWLGMTVLLGCAIASLPPLRLTFRYASALLGLIPVAIYFVSATRVPDAAVAITPYRATLAAPWLLAAVASCVICAFALATARLLNYRPGGIAPLLAVLFAVPVVLFHTKVGRDELEYRILEDRVGPGSRFVFVNRSLETEARRQAMGEWTAEQGADLTALFEIKLAASKERAIDQEAADRADVVQRCDAFLSRFAESRYAPNVLYLKGRALDLRIDRRLLAEKNVLQFHADVPRPASRPVWTLLVNQFPDIELAAHAMYQLALLDARDGNVDGAVTWLERLLSGFSAERTASQPAAPREAATMFLRPPASRSLGFDVQTALIPGRRLLELIRSTRADPRYGAQPLRDLLALDPRHPDYPAHLANLLARYPRARIEATVALRLAVRAAASRAPDLLRRLAADYANDAGEPEVLYHFGRALEESGDLNSARDAYARLIDRHPRSCYAADARDRLPSIILLTGVGMAPGG